VIVRRTENRPNSSQKIRRIVLRVFLASIAVNTILGVWALLVDDFGQTQGKVLATSFLVSAAMLAVLINIPATNHRVLFPVPVVAAVAGATGFFLFIVLVWAEVDNTFWLKTGGSLMVIAAGATLASNLGLIKLAARHLFLQWVAQILIAALSASILLLIWAEIDSTGFARLVGVQSVLVAATTLTIPAVSRFGGATEQSFLETAVRFCPSCGGPVDPTPLDGGPVRCGRCDWTFEVVRSDPPDIEGIERVGAPPAEAGRN
jgi:hypothetical protein